MYLLKLDIAKLPRTLCTPPAQTHPCESTRRNIKPGAQTLLLSPPPSPCPPIRPSLSPASNGGLGLVALPATLPSRRSSAYCTAICFCSHGIAGVEAGNTGQRLSDDGKICRLQGSPGAYVQTGWHALEDFVVSTSYFVVLERALCWYFESTSKSHGVSWACRISGYPTIKAWVSGRAVEYNGDRSAKSLKDWAVGLIPNKITTVNKQPQLDSFFSQCSGSQVRAQLLVPFF